MAIDKLVDPNIAAGAYGNASNLVKKPGAGGDDGVSFSDFLKNTAQNAVNTVRNSEAMSAKAVTGNADITDVVQAVTSAELTLQTVVAVRDRLLGAYQEIMRMGI